MNDEQATESLEIKYIRLRVLAIALSFSYLYAYSSSSIIHLQTRRIEKGFLTFCRREIGDVVISNKRLGPVSDLVKRLIRTSQLLVRH